MKVNDFKNLDGASLKSLILEKKEKIRQLKFDLASGKVKNVREIRAQRKEIARIKTLLLAKNKV